MRWREKESGGCRDGGEGGRKKDNDDNGLKNFEVKREGHT